MDKIIFTLMITLLAFVSGCAQKAQEQAYEETVTEEAMQPQQPQEQISLTPTEQPQSVEQPSVSAAAGADVVAVSTPFVKPTVKEIQQALQNAGLYQGKIDGILGPNTKKAIEDFQAQNNLKVDGKVGPRTWSKLKVYLSQ